MLQSEASYAVSDTVDLHRKRRGRRVRDPGKADRYQARKLAGLCTTCGAETVPDRQMCSKHLESARAATRAAHARRRAELRKKGLCTNGCGRSSTTWRCFVCAVRSGETPAFSPAESDVNSGVNVGRDYSARRERVAAATRRDIEGAAAYSRVRYHGRGRRGVIGNAANDALDARLLQRELEAAITELAYAHSPEVRARPRLQASGVLHAALSRLHLVQRLLGEILERHRYAR